MSNVLELKSIISDVLDVPEEELQEETRLNTLENWDSLNTLRLLSQIEKHYNTRLELGRFQKVQTVGELAHLVEA